MYLWLRDAEDASVLAGLARDLGYLPFRFDTLDELQDQIDATPPHLVICEATAENARAQVAQLRARAPRTWFPVILRSSDTGLPFAAHDADDVLVGPPEARVLAPRLTSLIRLKLRYDSMGGQNQLLVSRNNALRDELQARNEELERLTVGLVGALEQANLLNDEDTGNHIRRVCHFSAMLAEGAGLPPLMSDKIFRYASLHDVGKVGIPDSILKKRGKLTRDEFEVMKRHTVIGYELLAASGVDDVAKNIAIGHHERWDGTGYPRRLAGAQIPVEARIVALADVYDALTSERCYKRAFPRERAVAILRDEAGTHFDPELVRLFLARMPEVIEIQDRFQG